MEFFDLRPSRDGSNETTVNHATLQQRMGDGYISAVGIGINRRMQTQPVRFVQPTKALLMPYINFLDRHGQSKRFFWLDLVHDEPLVWRASEYKVQQPIKDGVTYLVATFQQCNSYPVPDPIAPVIDTASPIESLTPPTISGTSEGGHSIKIFNGATLVDTVQATVAGTWSFTMPATAAGVHNITAKAVDPFENESAASNIVVWDNEV